MEEIAVLEVLRRHLYLIVALCLITGVAGYVFSFAITEKYDATATVLVRPHEPIKIQGAGDTGKEFLDFPVGQMASVETASRTYIQIIKSTALVDQVVRELNLDKPQPDEEVGSGVFAWLSACLKAGVKDSKDYLWDAVAIVKYGRLLKPDPFTKAVDDVGRGLSLKSYEDTYVFDIKYRDKRPRTAAAVANTTAKLFIQFMEKMRSSEAKFASDHLTSELEQSRERLIAARRNLENYKESHGVVLYQQQYDAQLRVISDLQVELANLDQSLAASPGTLAARADAAKRERLLQILNQRRVELNALPGIERELKLREAEVDVARTTYDTVAKDLKDAEIKGSDPVPAARLISPAAVPELPSRPRRGIIAIASLLSGLLVGVALAFFLEYINRRVRGIHDVEETIGLKVVGTIPDTDNLRPWRGPSTETAS